MQGRGLGMTALLLNTNVHMVVRKMEPYNQRLWIISDPVISEGGLAKQCIPLDHKQSRGVFFRSKDCRHNTSRVLLLVVVSFRIHRLYE